MYAIIEYSGKQYKVSEGDIIDIDKSDKNEGSIDLGTVLFIGGDNAQHKKEVLQKTKVTGEILNSNKGPKVIIYKYKKRKNSNKKTGHRQNFTRVKITKIAVA